MSKGMGMPEKRKINWAGGRTVRQNTIEEDIGHNKALDACRPLIAKLQARIAELEKENTFLKECIDASYADTKYFEKKVSEKRT